MENPPPLTRADVESANMARSGRCRALAARAAADQQQIFEDHWRTRVVAARGFGQLPVQAVLHVQHAAIGEFRHQLAGVRVEAVHRVLGGPGHENATIVAIGPVRDAPIDALGAAHANPVEGIEVPQHLAGGSVQRAHLHLSGGDVHPAIHDNRGAFDLGGRPYHAVAGGMNPGDLQLGSVGAVNLVQLGVAGGTGRAAVVRPVVRSAEGGAAWQGV